MAEKQPIPRRYIENALNFLKSIQLELEAGLDPEKGFVSGFYLNEKLLDLRSEMLIILDRYSEEVEPPKEKTNA